MASESRALRKYCKLKTDYPIVTNIMYDSRMNKLAKEEYKKRQFFFGALSGFPIVIGQNDWEKDIIHCTEALRENAKLLDGFGKLLQITNTLNEKTLEFKPYTGMPVYCKNNIVVTTYINQFKGYIEPRIIQIIIILERKIHIYNKRMIYYRHQISFFYCAFCTFFIY